jgi:hypothetical protein
MEFQAKIFVSVRNPGARIAELGGTHEMVLVLLANRKDSARFRISHYDGSKMEWDGIFNDDTVSMELSRLGDHNPQ